MKFIGENFILLNFTTDKQVESEVASTTGHASYFYTSKVTSNIIQCASYARMASKALF